MPVGPQAGFCGRSGARTLRRGLTLVTAAGVSTFSVRLTRLCAALPFVCDQGLFSVLARLG